MADSRPTDSFEQLQLEVVGLDEIRRWTALEDALTVAACEQLAAQSEGDARAHFEAEADEARRDLLGEPPAAEPVDAELRFSRRASPRLRVAMAQITLTALRRDRPRDEIELGEARLLASSADIEGLLGFHELGIYELGGGDATLCRQMLQIRRLRVAVLLRLGRQPDIYGRPRGSDLTDAATSCLHAVHWLQLCGGARGARLGVSRLRARPRGAGRPRGRRRSRSRVRASSGDSDGSGSSEPPGVGTGRRESPTGARL